MTHWYCAVCEHREQTTRFVTAVTHTHAGQPVVLEPLTWAQYCRRRRGDREARRAAQWDAALATLAQEPEAAP